MHQQRSACRRTEFSLYRAAVDGNALQQIGRSRRRHRHNAVGAAHRSASYVDRRNHHLFRLQQIHRAADAGHIRHRIQRAYFMIMHISHRAAVGFGFRAGNGIIHAFCLPLYLFRKIQAVDDLGNMARRGMMMAMIMTVRMFVLVTMRMLMFVAVRMLVTMFMRMFMAMAAVFFCRFRFFFPIHRHRHMGAGDAAGSAGLGLQPDAGQPQPVHHIEKALFIVQKFVQGRHQHIACRPHIAFNVQRFHRPHPPFP